MSNIPEDEGNAFWNGGEAARPEGGENADDLHQCGTRPDKRSHFLDNGCDDREAAEAAAREDSASMAAAEVDSACNEQPRAVTANDCAAVHDDAAVWVWGED